MALDEEASVPGREEYLRDLKELKEVVAESEMLEDDDVSTAEARKVFNNMPDSRCQTVPYIEDAERYFAKLLDDLLKRQWPRYILHPIRTCLLVWKSQRMLTRVRFVT